MGRRGAHPGGSGPCAVWSWRRWRRHARRAARGIERAAALSGGCDAEARGAAEAALGRLRDPEAVRQREREARAAAAEARLGGLTPAQKAFMLRSKAGSSLKR